MTMTPMNSHTYPNLTKDQRRFLVREVRPGAEIDTHVGRSNRASAGLEVIVGGNRFRIYSDLTTAVAGLDSDTDAAGALMEDLQAACPDWPVAEDARFRFGQAVTYSPPQANAPSDVDIVRGGNRTGTVLRGPRTRKEGEPLEYLVAFPDERHPSKQKWCPAKWLRMAHPEEPIDVAE